MQGQQCQALKVLGLVHVQFEVRALQPRFCGVEGAQAEAGGIVPEVVEAVFALGCLASLGVQGVQEFAGEDFRAEAVGPEVVAGDVVIGVVPPACAVKVHQAVHGFAPDKGVIRTDAHHQPGVRLTGGQAEAGQHILFRPGQAGHAAPLKVLQQDAVQGGIRYGHHQSIQAGGGFEATDDPIDKGHVTQAEQGL